MADISKCNGDKCDQKNTCYRFLVESNEYKQSWFAPDHTPTKCDYYIKAGGRSVSI